MIKRKKDKRKKGKSQPSHSLHYLDSVIGMGCHLLMYFCFLLIAVLLTSDSMFLVLYITVYKYSIFNLPLDLELYV